ncbi:hypothetical protein QJ367_004507 [Vibrio vulnificus]|nr:hypothetical protein [Vibrio vulnificus]
MIFEQAFMALPEFLTGTPFKRYQFEGTVVTAFSMAVLQELNARNVPNPVSLLRSEVAYPIDIAKRADLHIDLTNLNIFNEELESYGVYMNNWLEAKFCRIGPKGKPVTPILDSTFLLLKDLIRLCSLVPDNQLLGDKSVSGRYLLHAYQNEPSDYFVFNRNQNKKRVKREWINKIITPGKHVLEINDLGYERTNTFYKNVGKKARLFKLKVNITNLVHEPFPMSNDVYYVVLTRIDDFEIYIGNTVVGRKGGELIENQQGACLRFPRVANRILSN